MARDMKRGNYTDLNRRSRATIVPTITVVVTTSSTWATTIQSIVRVIAAFIGFRPPSHIQEKSTKLKPMKMLHTPRHHYYSTIT